MRLGYEVRGALLSNCDRGSVGLGKMHIVSCEKMALLIPISSTLDWRHEILALYLSQRLSSGVLGLNRCRHYEALTVMF